MNFPPFNMRSSHTFRYCFKILEVSWKNTEKTQFLASLPYELLKVLREEKVGWKSLSNGFAKYQCFFSWLSKMAKATVDTYYVYYS